MWSGCLWTTGGIKISHLRRDVGMKKCHVVGHVAMKCHVVARTGTTGYIWNDEVLCDTGWYEMTKSYVIQDGMKRRSPMWYVQDNTSMVLKKKCHVLMNHGAMWYIMSTIIMDVGCPSACLCQHDLAIQSVSAPPCATGREAGRHNQPNTGSHAAPNRGRRVLSFADNPKRFRAKKLAFLLDL